MCPIPYRQGSLCPWHLLGEEVEPFLLTSQQRSHIHPERAPVAVVVVTTAFTPAVPSKMQSRIADVAEAGCLCKQQWKLLQFKELCRFLENYNNTI